MPDLFASHERTFENNRYVYPVISRRSRGVSVGVNLSLDKVCNFDCVYCQVDRLEAADSELGISERIDLSVLEKELEDTATLVASGKIFEHPKFAPTPEPLRRFNDIAFSGNGEPTLCRRFSDVVQIAAEVRRRQALDDVRLVLITNATLLSEPWVLPGLEVLDANNGEIWAKLDAGTEEYYRVTSRSGVPFERILDNLTAAAVRRPIVIQTLIMRLAGEPPMAKEVEAYCARLSEILDAGGRIKQIQLHTVARVPAERWVSAVSPAFLALVADHVEDATGLRPDVF